MGCIVRSTQNDTTISTRQSNRTITISALWLSQRARFLSPIERQVMLNVFFSLFLQFVFALNTNFEFLRSDLCHLIADILDLYKKIKKAHPPLSLHGQLLWREFFYCAATKNGKFDRMEGNPICVQIPWDTNPEALAKWANVSGYLTNKTRTIASNETFCK